jgi:hypothetical protein
VSDNEVVPNIPGESGAAFVPLPLGADLDATYAQLAMAAARQELALYVGAGVSVGAPTLLPSSRQLLERLRPVAEDQLGITVADGDDELLTLESLADAAEDADCLEPLQELAVAAADFSNALPNYAHRVIATFVREGVTVFTVNWDRAIENGAVSVGYYVDVTISDGDRARPFTRTEYHKIHGCCSRPVSLLISSRQLETPPTWVEHEVGAALGAHTFVFVGLGTVGGYVRRRVQQVLTALGAHSPVWLADPFPARAWDHLRERAGASHILTIGAEAFFDNLLRSFLRLMLSDVRSAAEALDVDTGATTVRDAAVRLHEALEPIAPLDVAVWLRTAAKGVNAGNPFIHSRECRDGLLAIAAVAGDSEVRLTFVGEELILSVGTAFVELAVWPERDASSVVCLEEALVDARYSRGIYPNPAWPIYHVCVGVRGALPRRGVEADIVDEPPSGDVLAARAEHVWIAAEHSLQSDSYPVNP